MKRISMMLFAALLALALTGCLGGGPADNVPAKYTISGRIVIADSVEGLEGVTLAFSNEAVVATTNEEGNWTRTGLSGTVTVTPSKEGWTFNPSSREVSAASSSVNFIATAVSPTDQYTVTRHVEGQGTISIDPDQPTYTAGTNIQLTATADSGWAFTHWEGDVEGTDNPITVSLNGDLEVTAVFGALGEIPITSEPSGAVIYIDGEEYGVTPATITLPEGAYLLTLKEFQHRDYTRPLIVRPGENRQVDARLWTTGYWPLAVGNYWEYEGYAQDKDGNAEALTYHSSIVDEHEHSELDLFVMDEQLTLDGALIEHDITVFGRKGDAYGYFAYWDEELGGFGLYGLDEVFRVPIRLEQGEDEYGYWSAVVEEVTVPAGTFKAIIMDRTFLSWGSPVERTVLWFVPYVGPIRQEYVMFDEEGEIAYEVVAELVDYDIGK